MVTFIKSHSIKSMVKDFKRYKYSTPEKIEIIKLEKDEFRFLEHDKNRYFNDLKK